MKTYQISNRIFEIQDWSCKCGNIDSFCHIIRCPEYEHLRQAKDLKFNEDQLVKYFQDVINLRDEAQQAE